jgi:hypothetical protein
MDNKTVVVVVVELIVMGAAWWLLTSPARAVRIVRGVTLALAAASILATVAGWVLARPWALEALARGALVAGVVGVAVGSALLLRGRLRPRAFASQQRKYARYAKYSNYRRVG